MPTNPVVAYQDNLTLSVTASSTAQTYGFPIGYQWKFNGTNVGFNASSYTLTASSNAAGIYSVAVTNAAGSVSASWQVSITYAGSVYDPATLSYYLATNAVARTNGFTPANMVELSGWTWAVYYPTNLHFLTNSVWSTNFWLKGVQGLSATAIGQMNQPGGQGLPTMASPRHYLFATHMHPEGNPLAFLDTNNVIYWRTTLQRVDVANDISVGIIDADLPPSVGYLPVAPTNLSSYLPTNSASVVQGIGMNQDLMVFSQPMTFNIPSAVAWNSTHTIPFGLGTNWSIHIRGGDSSAPARLLVGNQLVLISDNHDGSSGPNYAPQFNAINQQMHYLSTNHSVGTDYQLTPFSLTNWPIIH